MNTHLIFVYGSLKAGFHNHRLLSDIRATDMGYAVTDERYLLVKGVAFPYLINPEHFTKVEPCDGLIGNVAGELYRVSDKGLGALDQLESHPSFYRREVIKVNDGVETWAYFLSRPSERWDNPMRYISNAIAKPNADGIAEWTRDDVCAVAAQDDGEE